jgi:hypothetical protein
MRQPEFTIIAGANGVGKSSMGELFLNGGSSFLMEMPSFNIIKGRQR